LPNETCSRDLQISGVTDATIETAVALLQAQLREHEIETGAELLRAVGVRVHSDAREGFCFSRTMAARRSALPSPPRISARSMAGRSAGSRNSTWCRTREGHGCGGALLTEVLRRARELGWAWPRAGSGRRPRTRGRALPAAWFCGDGARSFHPHLRAVVHLLDAADELTALAVVDRRIVYMKSSTKDKIKGRAAQVKGVVKEKAGRATKNRDVEASGTADKVGGTVRNKLGDIKKVFGK
jgi:uncharacterized protein YjbJ (UPF0337 family)